MESDSAPVALPVYVPGEEVMGIVGIPMSKKSQPSPVPALEQRSASPSRAFAWSQPDPSASRRCSSVSKRAFQSIMWETWL